MSELDPNLKLKQTVLSAPDLGKDAEELVKDFCENFEKAVANKDVVAMAKYHPSVMSRRLFQKNLTKTECFIEMINRDNPVSYDSRNMYSVIRSVATNPLSIPKYRNVKRVTFI